jgi:hypothetical protein
VKAKFNHCGEKYFQAAIYITYIHNISSEEKPVEIRKMQKIKGGSFTLSLPKQWVENAS